MLESEYHECDELFPLLLAKGADPWLHAPDDGDTALHLAASLGRTEKCAMLLAVRGRRTVDLLNDVGVTPLMKAAAFGHLQTGNYNFRNIQCEVYMLELKCRPFKI
jgi:ankyrin repeat protein